MRLNRQRARAWAALPVVAAGLALAPAPLLAQTPALKLAVVDLDRVVALSDQGQALQKRLAKLQEDTQAKLEEKTQKIQGLRDSLAGKNPDEGRALQKQIEDETLGGRRLREDAERTAQKWQAEELEKIKERLRPVFEKIQQESAYDLILNFNPAVVISAGQSIDITERVLKTLNETPAAAPSGQ